MSDFEVALPDGRSIVVDAADEMGARKAANNFLMREKGAAKGKQGGVDNFVRSVAQGASLGFGDEIAAAGDATVGPPIDWALGKLGLGKTGTSEAPAWSERYGQNLERERGQDKAYADEFPAWDTTGKVTGGVGGMLAMAPRALMAGGIGLPGIAKSAGAGATLGGLGGFGEGEGGLGNRLVSGGKGMATGGVLGALLHPVASVVGNVGGAIAESAPGRYVADKIVVPGMRKAADALDAIAPKASIQSLSAAAPEGGSLPSGMLADAADTLRSGAPTDILDNAAARRIADALRRGGGDVPGVRARVGELGPDAMLADTDPMVTRLARTAYIAPGGAARVIDDAMTARNRATGQRIGQTTQEAMGDSQPAVLESGRLRQLRSREGADNYASAVGPDAPYTVSPQMRQIMQEAPAVQRAMDAITQNAADRGVTLTPAQVAHRVKQQLASDADAAFASGRAINKDDVRSLAERWRTALHEANPAIREADAGWQAATNRIDALDLGRQFMRQGTGEVADAVSPAVLAERIPRMSAEEARAFIAGAADTLMAKASSGLRPARQVASAIDENQNLRSKLVSMLGEERATMLFNRAMGERRFAATDRAIRGGSDTASKLLSVMDDAASGDIPTSPNSIVTRVIGKAVDAYNKQRAGNEAVRERIARMLTETDAATNEETIDRIAAILAQQARRPRAIRGAAGSGGQVQE